MHVKYLTPQALTSLMYLDYYFFTQFILTLQIQFLQYQNVCVCTFLYTVYIYIYKDLTGCMRGCCCNRNGMSSQLHRV